MSKIVRVPVMGGPDVPGREVDFEPVKEPWSEYRLLDGGSVKMRVTAMRIFRVVDETGEPAYAPDGQPAVVVNQQVQIVASE